VTHTNLVVGTGYLGKRFLDLQAAASNIGLNRSPLAQAHQVETYDLDSGGQIPLQLPDRYSILYTVPPSSDSEHDSRLQRMLQALTHVPARFVYISTTGVYGNRNGRLVDEETPVNPESGRARIRVAAEKLLQSWGTEHNVPIVILRVPGIYGPQRLGTERVREGSPVIAENDTGPGNRIHVDDLVRCCSAGLSDDTPAGIYNVGDGDNRSSTWFTNEVARQCDLPAPPTIGMQDAAREFSPMRMSFLRESRLVDTRKMRDGLRILPRYANAEDGIRASLDEEYS